MSQMATGATALKEPSDAALAQASTHARRRTAGRHRVVQPPTRPPAHHSQAPAPLQRGTRPTHAAHCGTRVDSGNKIVASAHGMGSGCLAVDAMVIGRLGVERRVERFFVLSHLERGTTYYKAVVSVYYCRTYYKAVRGGSVSVFSNVCPR